MNYLLDTCVISELASPSPNGNVVSWIDDLSDENVFISVITIGEIKRGIDRLSMSARKRKLEKWLESLLLRFDDTIVSVDTSVVLSWGEMIASLDKVGRPMPALDSLIAATAKFHHLVLATRNTLDFKHAGIQLFNPWQSKG